MFRHARSGFTLLEVLTSLGLLGLITVYLFQNIGTTTQVSVSTNAANDLIREGQIAQQVLVSRIKEACHVYPIGTIVRLGSDFTTLNKANSPDDEWRVGTDPIVAMILPPQSAGGAYRFFAYYAIPRGQYTKDAVSEANPGRDPLNEDSVWMLLEYRRDVPIMPAGTLCSSMPGNTNYTITGGIGRLLADYVTPDGTADLFDIGAINANGSASFVQYDLRFQKQTRGTALTQVGSGASGTTLAGNIYPVNLGL
jgi:prepilin-type N-terminal cleavage/methylation domain-containing protein